MGPTREPCVCAVPQGACTTSPATLPPSIEPSTVTVMANSLNPNEPKLQLVPPPQGRRSSASPQQPRTASVMATSFTPTIPYCSRSATRHARDRSCGRHSRACNMCVYLGQQGVAVWAVCWALLGPPLPPAETLDSGTAYLSPALPLCSSSHPPTHAPVCKSRPRDHIQCRWPAQQPLLGGDRSREGDWKEGMVCRCTAGPAAAADAGAS